jgi:hypothetical protein
MIEAVFIDWDNALLTGTARSADGQEYELRYDDGQSFYTSDDHPLPQLTGKHKQPTGYHLKVPQVGDPILIQFPLLRQTQAHWGYMRHYIDLVERRYGTAFVAVD